jgi:hypothetical protein
MVYIFVIFFKDKYTTIYLILYSFINNIIKAIDTIYTINTNFLTNKAFVSFIIYTILYINYNFIIIKIQYTKNANIVIYLD